MIEHKSIVTIFGATGNLTYNKLMPALYQLLVEEKLTKDVSIVAIGRSVASQDEYISKIQGIIQKKMKSYSEELFNEFKSFVHYYKMDFTKEEEFEGYKTFIDNLDDDNHGNRIYYLATAPSFFGLISKRLEKYGLLTDVDFKRAVFEKPFGYDLDSATEINEEVTSVFGEENIYRIDHYLGKEMIQDIILARFSNQVFRSVWNKESIDNIQITVNENVGVEERGGYYDKSGALRDMVQNHLLQIMTFVAMEPPADFDTESIRDEKVKVLKQIKIKDEHMIFGQYDGYKEEPKVDPDSDTETFVALKCEIKNDRWIGVPFYLRTGKNLKSKEAHVIIEFKNNYCYEHFDEQAKSNLLIIKIQPEEGIYFRINTKRPRSENELMSVYMDYCQSCNIAYNSPEAYERLLFDIIKGDSTLFTRWDEVEGSWKIIKKLDTSKKELQGYEPQSNGPKAAKELVENEGRIWWDLAEIDEEKYSLMY